MKKKYTHKEIGKILNLSDQRVSEMEKNALRKLRLILSKNQAIRDELKEYLGDLDSRCEFDK